MSAPGPAVAGRGMVCAAHPAVSAAGADVLAGGGTAADAVLAMVAASYLALPGQCGIGGDAFALVYDAGTGRYAAIDGSGPGPAGGDPDFYAGRGLSAVPLTGPLAVAVPGAAGCVAALHARCATRPLEELWAPAVRAARDGRPLSAKTAGDIAAHREMLAADPAAAAVFLPGGRPPRPGEPLAQPHLAATLARLARHPADLYTGELAERCVAALRAAGAPFDGGEWAAQRSTVGQPVSHPYGRAVIHTTPVPSAGYLLLAQAGVLSGVLSRLPLLGAHAVHWMAEAAAAAFADRVATAGSDTPGWRAALDDGAITRRRDRIAADLAAGTGARAARGVPVRPGGDTTSFVAVDAAGNAVSFIHSLALTFGAGVMVPGTGVMLNNRLGRGAYLLPGHPNAVAPGRRPMHTLLAWILAGPGGTPVAVGNTPGGDGQVQWGMQLVSHLVDHGLDPRAAVSAPRFTLFPGTDAHVLGAPVELRCEDRLGAATLAGLRRLGHRVRVVGPYAGGGAAQVITIDPAGRLLGGSDPREDGRVRGV